MSQFVDMRTNDLADLLSYVETLSYSIRGILKIGEEADLHNHLHKMAYIAMLQALDHDIQKTISEYRK